jgi:hypothetical protein
MGANIMSRLMPAPNFTLMCLGYPLSRTERGAVTVVAAEHTLMRKTVLVCQPNVT